PGDFARPKLLVRGNLQGDRASFALLKMRGAAPARDLQNNDVRGDMNDARADIQAARGARGDRVGKARAVRPGERDLGGEAARGELQGAPHDRGRQRIKRRASKRDAFAVRGRKPGGAEG